MTRIRPTQPAWLPRALQALGLVAVFAVAVLAVAFGEVLRERFQGAGYFAVLLITATASATILLPAPAAVTVGAFAQALDNIWLVGLVAATGQTLGEFSGYYIGWTGKSAVARIRGYQKVRYWMSRYGVLTLFTLALVPNPFFDIAGMVAGASRFGLIKFVIASWPGRAIKNLGFAWAGVASIENILPLVT
jgi:membrane protein DedA with SNARE-associated domain